MGGVFSCQFYVKQLKLSLQFNVDITISVFNKTGEGLWSAFSRLHFNSAWWVDTGLAVLDNEACDQLMLLLSFRMVDYLIYSFE